MADKSFNLQPPLAGLNKKTSHKQKPPFNTPSCLNVRPYDPVQQRDRVGSRPGLGKYFFEQCGSGNPINMISDISAIISNSKRLWVDYFEGTSIDTIWSTPGWITYPPTIINDGGLISVYNTEGGLVRSALSPFVIATEYNIDLIILPYLGQHWGRYQIFMSLNDTTPAVNTEGVICEVTLTGSTGAYTGRVVDISSGVGTTTTITPGTLSYSIPCVLTALRNGTNVKMYLNGVLLANVTVAAHTGTRFGLSMYSTVINGVCLVDGFRIQYTDGIYNELQKNLFTCASNGLLYSNSTYVNKLVAVTTNLKLATAPELIQACDRYQKLYIADYSEKITSQTDGVVSTTSLSSATITNWASFTSLNIYDFVVVITAGSGPTAGVYNISSIDTNHIHLASSPGDGSAISFYVQRAPKIYNPAAGTLTLWTATSGKGSLPIGSYCVCLYRDRLVLALEHLWYMSRQNDPLDWDYDQTDVQRAVAGQTSEAGMIAQKIIAMVSHGDDYLVFFGKTTTWKLRGDPTYGGQADNISRTIGCVDKQAWCLTPGSVLVFLSLDGIYGLSGDTEPQKISGNNLPLDLMSVDNNLYIVTMAYDVDYGGIHIYLTQKTGGLSDHWFFDWGNKSFWLVSLQITHQPYSLINYTSSDIGMSGTLLGCKDGYIRSYNKNNETDEGYEIDSNVMYGPMATWDDYNNGRIEEMVFDLARDSGQVHYQLLKATTAQKCLEDPIIFSSGAIPLAGLNYKIRPKMKSEFWALKLSNEDTNRRWSVENINIASEKAGIKRLL